MKFVERLHTTLVYSRRVRVLAELLAQLLPKEARCIVDIGCGDGRVAELLAQSRPELVITGIDVLVRPQTSFFVQPFDGISLPLADESVDIALLVDVLHHTTDPMVLLREAQRVARQSIVIKDHCRDGFLAGPTLRFMDWVGNAHHGVALPYNYWSDARWRAAFEELGLEIDSWSRHVPLYPWPASWVFGRKLHFVARLNVAHGMREPASHFLSRSERATLAPAALAR